MSKPQRTKEKKLLAIIIIYTAPQTEEARTQFPPPCKYKRIGYIIKIESILTFNCLRFTVIIIILLQSITKND
ncbi:hypothetical protein DERF_000892 [Dermatophagoides farinae]|uniref:Uncharacterized protein n=1 Tax=Dermatophagoides farinae TaxID=6954 RepID=A0A922I8B9_DERFA|nr:hypothetical protein DERF_000892 [Dermatophagoides farinae]